MQVKKKLHQVKFGIQFKNIQVRLFVHQKKLATPITPNFEYLPVLNMKFFKGKRSEEIKILHVWNENMPDTLNYDINCTCKCHSCPDTEDAQFHSYDCICACLTSNEQYIQYLMTLVHPVYVT